MISLACFRPEIWPQIFDIHNTSLQTMIIITLLGEQEFQPIFIFVELVLTLVQCSFCEHDPLTFCGDEG